MKTDRFVRVMLVIIAALLFLNWFTPDRPDRAVFQTRVEAASPAFFKAGKSYRCFYSNNSEQPLKIIQVDPGSGWVQSDTQFGKFWYNTGIFASCLE